jgi:hypothetical protein
MLKDTIDNIFAVGLDERMMASLPDFWKLYYQAMAAKADYRPQDPAVPPPECCGSEGALADRFRAGLK